MTMLQFRSSASDHIHRPSFFRGLILSCRAVFNTLALALADRPE